MLVIVEIPACAQGIPVPPTPPEILTQKALASKSKAAAVAAEGAVQFSIGNPTDEEQMLLELINRARTNATAEATRLLSSTDPYVQAGLAQVDAELMKAQFATNPPVAPLSFNARLIDAARAHTQYLFQNAIQTHSGPGPTDTLLNRLETVGYSFQNAAENVFSYSENIEFGHAGFEVDWNGTSENGGMQTPAGHRTTIHNGIYKEVGIGVVLGSNTVTTSTTTNTVGPMLITQDFGLPADDVSYDHLIEWKGAGYLARGAAATDEVVA